MFYHFKKKQRRQCFFVFFFLFFLFFFSFLLFFNTHLHLRTHRYHCSLHMHHACICSDDVVSCGKKVSDRLAILLQDRIHDLLQRKESVCRLALHQVLVLLLILLEPTKDGDWWSIEVLLPLMAWPM